MPYIITTRRPTSPASGLKLDAWLGDVSRRAVTTLEGAREACVTIVQPYASEELRGVRGPIAGPVAGICLGLMRKDWSGDTITLPDGTTIEVERVDDGVLREACPLIFTSDWLRMSEDERCAAFNAAQTTKTEVV